jgi:hypothetical protein
MSGAAATTNPDFVAAWSDDTGTSFTEGATDGVLNGASQVTLVAAPAASTRRIIKTVYIENKDTAAVTITVTYNNNGTLRTIAKVTLQVADTWSTDGTTDSSGALKQTMGTVSLTTGVTGVLPNTNGGTGQSSAFTQYGVTYANATTTLATTAAGTSTTVLHGNASGAPTFGAVSLTADVSGTLPNTSGGTGQSSAFTQYGVTYASTTSALATTAAGSAGQVLTSNGSSAPTFQTSSGVTTGKAIAMAMIFGF